MHPPCFPYATLWRYQCLSQHRAPACTSLYIPRNISSTQSSTRLRQILVVLGAKVSDPSIQVSQSTLLDEAAIKPASEPSKPSKFATFDEACALPEAKHSVHHELGGPACGAEAVGMSFYNEPKAVRPKALESSAVPDESATLLDSEPSCAAASPAVTKPKSYAAVSRPLVVTAAPPHAAAVPKLSAAASLQSSGLKPSSAASQLAADTTSLEVSTRICTLGPPHSTAATRQEALVQRAPCSHLLPSIPMDPLPTPATQMYRARHLARRVSVNPKHRQRKPIPN